MAISNVFRHSIPNPFHGSKWKSRQHSRSGNASNSSSSVVIVPIPEEKDTKGKQRKRDYTSPKSNRSSFSACDLEQLQPSNARSSLSIDTVSQLQVSMAPFQDTLSSPSSACFSPSPLSPEICMPTSPSPPSTPMSPDAAKFLPLSPEPITSPTRGIRGSRFESFFTKGRRESGELKLPQQENGIGQDQMPMPQPKRKRLSAGSLQTPIGAFLSNPFRNKPASLTARTQFSEGEQPQHLQRSSSSTLQSLQEPPQQKKKRKSLLPKLPKLDTRPRIVLSTPILKSSLLSRKSKEVKSVNVNSQEPQQLDGSERASVLVPSTTSLGTSGSGLLATSHLPTNIIPGSRPVQQQQQQASQNSSRASYGAKQELEPFWEWRENSRAYHDDRWDRASVLTVDSETSRLADDPNFPGYPERNAYWQKYCRIRERRWKKHMNQQHQGLVRRATAKKWQNRIRDECLDESLGQDVDADRQLGDKLKNMTMMLHSNLGQMGSSRGQARRRGTNSQNRSLQNRVRYTNYNAYMAAMQLKAKNRRPSVDLVEPCSPTEDLSPKLPESLVSDLRVLQERTLDKGVKALADQFEGSVSDDDKRQKSFDLYRDHQLHLTRHMDGTNAGCGNDDNEDQEKKEKEPRQVMHQRPRRTASGILFVSSTTSTAEVYPALVHDTRAPLKFPLAIQKKEYLPNMMQNTCMLQHLGGYISSDEERIGCLVASYFDEKLFGEGYDDGSGGGSGAGCGGEGGLVGNGFVMLQSSFGDQGLPDAHSSHNPPSSSYSGRSRSSGSSSSSRCKHDQVDHCLSRPGEYATRNHIMPLQQLLELEEARHRKKQPLIPSHQATAPSTAQVPGESSSSNALSTTSSRTEPNIDLEAQPPVITHTQHPSKPQQDPKSHMLLMVFQDRHQYYKDGTRKRGSQWEDDFEDNGTHENGVIKEEEEKDEEDQVQLLKHQTKPSNENEDESELPIPLSLPACGTRDDSRRTGDNALSVTPTTSLISASGDSSNEPSESSTAACSSQPINLSTPSSTPSSSLDPTPAPTSSSAKMPSLSKARGAKSRASISCSTLSMVATPSHVTLSPNSTSALVPSSASTQLLASRHRKSSSMASELLSAGSVTQAPLSLPMQPSTSSTTTFTWPDFSQYPASASAMLMDALAKPMKMAFLIQTKDQDMSKTQSSQSAAAAVSADPESESGSYPITSPSSSSILPQSLQKWKSFFLSTDDPSKNPDGAVQVNNNDDQSLIKKQLRTSSMIEFSAASSTSRLESTDETFPRRRYKTVASTLTSNTIPPFDF
ncbi:hypothetical protein BGZ51_000997 [Haplosporangium sp. Z 767]|nr:hypothetical protein BGZ51_000997 [Haplosporangium sp. Z 767]KAF9190005.1 hypothetical protein BGZ50_000469 [Haplosporangium sp. Z 11]